LLQEIIDTLAFGVLDIFGFRISVELRHDKLSTARNDYPLEKTQLRFASPAESPSSAVIPLLLRLKSLIQPNQLVEVQGAEQ
jgi:hypothetical protein